MSMWNSGSKVVYYWRLELGLINQGRFLNPVHMTSEASVT